MEIDWKKVANILVQRNDFDDSDEKVENDPSKNVALVEFAHHAGNLYQFTVPKQIKGMVVVNDVALAETVYGTLNIGVIRGFKKEIIDEGCEVKDLIAFAPYLRKSSYTDTKIYGTWVVADDIKPVVSSTNSQNQNLGDDDLPF